MSKRRGGNFHGMVRVRGRLDRLDRFVEWLGIGSSKDQGELAMVMGRSQLSEDGRGQDLDGGRGSAGQQQQAG